MKTIHRIFSLLLVCMLAVSLAVPARATDVTPGQSVVQVPTEGNFSLTINNAPDGHTYELYMIFYGSHHQVATNTEPVLTDIKWGTGVSQYGTTYVTAGTDAGTVAAGLTENTIEAFTRSLVLKDVFAQGQTKDGQCVFTKLPAGYYLVKDKDNSLADKNSQAYTSYIVRVLGNETASPKVNVPSLEKKTSDINDTTHIPGEYDSHVDSADFDIGDNVPFHIHINVGDNIVDYTQYEMVVTDTLSKGLTFNDDVVVMLEKKKLEKGEDKDYTIAVTGGENGDKTIVITFQNLIASGVTNTDTLSINYTARLNEGAVIGTPGNPNSAYLEYSNNPYNTGSKGKTPTDTVVIYTYQVTVNKKNATNQDLTGATFKLSKYIHGNVWEVVKTIEGTNKSIFEFKGLDDGTYKLEEVTPPAGYNSIKPFEFRIDATHNETKVTSLTATPLHGSGQAFTPTEGKTDATSDGILHTTVVNQMGASLPTTGGMGTTLIYALGGILVLAAVVLLVTKKRMSDAE